MIPRVIFLSIAIFWATMNVLLWHAEYGSHGGVFLVPADLVWRKILTAPDISSLTIYQNGQRSGYCEFSTGVGLEMAKLDENSPPPGDIAARAGYQIRINGGTGFGETTNRFKFDVHLQFSTIHDWKEMNMKISSHDMTVQIHSIATNRAVNLEITSDGTTESNVLTFASLQNPKTLLRTFAGNYASGFLDGFDLPNLPQTSDLAQNLHWQASRERLMLGREPVSVYRLETQVLQNKITIYASTLGEILRVELPCETTAMIEGWGKP